MDQNTIEDFRSFISEHLNEKSSDSLWKEVQFNFLRSKSDRRAVLPHLEELVEIQFPAIIAHKPIRAENGEYVTDFVVSDFKPDFSSRVAKRSKKSGSGDLSHLGGSPLKLQEFADLSVFSSPVSNGSPRQFIKKSHVTQKYGVTVKQARQYQSLMNICWHKIQNFPKSFLIFCDGNDSKRTACVLTDYIDGGTRSSVITVREPDQNNGHLPKLSKEMFNNVHVTCKAKYDMFNEMNDNTPESGYKGALVVQVEWNKIPSHFLQQPPVESHTVIKAQVTSGDMRSAAHSIFKELAMLQSLVAGLDTAEINWLADEYEKPTLEMVQELVERLKFGDSKQQTKGEEEQNNELSEVIGTLVFQSRKDLDFTDQLWNILIQCTSYDELVECFTYVFRVLRNEELHPLIHRNNNTTMAQLVKDSYVDKLRIPNLAGLYPLQLLAEMGAEKLKQDYVFIFLSKELATLSTLEPFISAKSDLKKQLSSLEKLHNVIEMVVMLKLFLKIPNTSLSSVALEMLRHYEHKEVANDHIFSFSVPEMAIRKIFENSPPSMWQMDATKQIQGVTESTMVVLTVDAPFEHMSNRKTSMTNGHNDLGNSAATIGNYFLVRKQDSVLFV